MNKKIDEIDIVAIKNSNKSIILGECRWKENFDASAILNELQRKTQNVEWNNNGKRSETYLIFAKSFNKKKIFGENIVLFDLNDLKKLLE